MDWLKKYFSRIPLINFDNSGTGMEKWPPQCRNYEQNSTRTHRNTFFFIGKLVTFPEVSPMLFQANWDFFSMGHKTRWTQELWIRKHLNTEQNLHTDRRNMNQIIKLTSDGSLGSFVGLTAPVVVSPGQSRRTYLARNFMNAQTPPGPPALTRLYVCSTGLHGNHKSPLVLDWTMKGCVGRWQMNVSVSTLAARLWSKSRCFWLYHHYVYTNTHFHNKGDVFQLFVMWWIFGRREHDPNWRDTSAQVWR